MGKIWEYGLNPLNSYEKQSLRKRDWVYSMRYLVQGNSSMLAVGGATSISIWNFGDSIENNIKGESLTHEPKYILPLPECNCWSITYLVPNILICGVGNGNIIGFKYIGEGYKEIFYIPKFHEGFIFGV